MKIAFNCTLLALVFLFPLRAQPGGETVTVEVQGLGKDAQSAEKNALYQAVERAVGTYLDNETVVKNEEVIRDKLLTVAQGFVQSYDVLSSPKERHDGSGLWEIKIKAVVKKSDVGAALRSVGVMAADADGRAAWATQITRLKSREDAMALLEKVIPEIPRNVVVCSLEQAGNKLQIQEDPKTGNQQVVVKVRMEINYNWWVKEAVPALDAALSQLRLRESKSQEFKLPQAFNISTDSNSLRTPRLVYNDNGYGRLSPITSLGWTSQNVLDFDNFERSMPRIAGSPVLLLTGVGSIFEFKTYTLPEDWQTKIHSLWHSGCAPDLFEAVTFKLESEDKKMLLEVPLKVSSDVLCRLGPINFSEQFTPALWEGIPSSIMSNITYTAKIDVPADTLKLTKRVILKAARFGIKQPAAPTTGASFKR